MVSGKSGLGNQGRSPSVNEGPLSSEEEPFADSKQTALVDSKPTFAESEQTGAELTIINERGLGCLKPRTDRPKTAEARRLS